MTHHQLGKLFLATLWQHSPIRLDQFHAIVANWIMGSGDHQSDGFSEVPAIRENVYILKKLFLSIGNQSESNGIF